MPGGKDSALMVSRAAFTSSITALAFEPGACLSTIEVAGWPSMFE